MALIEIASVVLIGFTLGIVWAGMIVTRKKFKINGQYGETQFSFEVDPSEKDGKLSIYVRSPKY